MDILGSQEDFPLDKRIGIAIKTAEALQYLHSSTTGIIEHGNVAASTILLDNNFSPKLTDFSGACKLITETEITARDGVITRNFLENILNNYPNHFTSVLKNLENDVYRFGGVLFALISRDNNTSLDELVLRFTEAYQTDDSGKAIFDKVIIAEQETIVLEDLGRLALKCTILNVDEMTMRPTMKEVAEQLHKIRRSWKGRTAEVATLESNKHLKSIEKQERVDMNSHWAWVAWAWTSAAPAAGWRWPPRARPTRRCRCSRRSSWSTVGTRTPPRRPVRTVAPTAWSGTGSRARWGGCGDGAAAGRSETLGRGGAGAWVRGGARGCGDGREPDGVREEESAQQATPMCGLEYIVGMICRGGS